MKCKAGLKWVDQKIIDEIIACGNYYVKSVQIELSLVRIFLYSVRIQKNTGQK